MKDVTMDKSKRKKLKRRNKTQSKQLRTHSSDLKQYRHGSSLASPMASGAVDGGQESPADREYRRMVGSSVHHGSSKKSMKSNESKRRYQ